MIAGLAGSRGYGTTNCVINMELAYDDTGILGERAEPGRELEDSSIYI